MNSFPEVGINITGKEGNIKTLCPECSHMRRNKTEPCLSVNTTEGVWNCHNCGWSGSLKKNNQYNRPIFRRNKLDKVQGWFAKRNISIETADFFNISCRPGYIEIPYYRGMQLINVKSKPTEKGNGRYFQTEKAEPIFFNLEGLKNRNTGVIVEGEMDVLALYEVGITNVISPPNGAPNDGDKNTDKKLACFVTCAKDIEHIKEWTIAVDNDSSGRRLKQELTRRLGAENCKVVNWTDYADCKDANDILIKHGREDLIYFINNSKHSPVDGIHCFSEYDEEINAVRLGKEMYPTVSCEIPNLQEKYRVAEGYVTVVTGIPSSGKSTLVSCIATEIARNHNWNFGVYCPENPKYRMSLKIIQAFGQKNITQMTDDELEAAKSFLGNHFKEILSPDDKIEPTIENILDRANILVKRNGIRGLIIDAYSRVSKNFSKEMNETQFISYFLDKVGRWAKKHNCHVWVVAHPYKIKKRKDLNGKDTPVYEIVLPYDISGSASWFNSADMILSVNRLFHDNDLVEVYIQKVKEQPEFGKLGKVFLNFEQSAGFYY